MSEDKPKHEEIESVDSIALFERKVLDIDLIHDKDKALELMSVLVKGKLAKDKGPEELLAIYLKTKELGLGFASAADHMHVIRGKTGVDIHIVRALLLRAGSNIWWEKTKDYEPQYKYTDGKNIWIKSENSDPDIFLPKECSYVYDKTSTDKCKADGKVPVWKDGLTPVDWVTTYKFQRVIKVDGESKILTEIGSFSWMEAIQAKLPMNKDGQYDPDSNWQKYRKLMLDHRAFTFGARAIGADLLNGVYEEKELLDIQGKSYLINGDGQVINQ